MTQHRVAILGAGGRGGFAWIAQSILCELADHPFFVPLAVLAETDPENPISFGEAGSIWYEARPLTEQVAALPFLPPNADLVRGMGVDFVISSLPPASSRHLDMLLAEGGLPVVSESPGLRAEEDVPLVTPDINADHLALLGVQRELRGWKQGFVVANPGCTYTILALALKPILDRFGIEHAVITTMQAISGAGPYGIAGLDIIDNVIPYIPQEEEKLDHEVRKILGRFDGRRVVPVDFPMVGTCCRVPVLDGHLASVTLKCTHRVKAADAIEAWRSYTGKAQQLELPSAPHPPIQVLDGIDRPQTRLDRDAGAGRTISIGRVRDASEDRKRLSFIVVGHNRRRGTFGNTLLNAELLAQEGWLQPREGA